MASLAAHNFSIIATASLLVKNTAPRRSAIVGNRWMPCKPLGRGALRLAGTCAALSKDQIKELMAQVDEGWEVHEGGSRGGQQLWLSRRYRTKNFNKALELCNRIGAVANEQGHHPDLHLEGWNNVTVELSTHSEGGVTDKDFQLASKVDALDKTDLLSKKQS